MTLPKRLSRCTVNKVARYTLKSQVCQLLHQPSDELSPSAIAPSCDYPDCLQWTSTLSSAVRPARRPLQTTKTCAHHASVLHNYALARYQQLQAETSTAFPNRRTMPELRYISHWRRRPMDWRLNINPLVVRTLPTGLPWRSITRLNP